MVIDARSALIVDREHMKSMLLLFELWILNPTLAPKDSTVMYKQMQERNLLNLYMGIKHSDVE